MAAMGQGTTGGAAASGTTTGTGTLADGSAAGTAVPPDTGASAGRFGDNTDLGGNGRLAVFGDLSPLQPVHIRTAPNPGGNPTLGARGVAPPTFVRGFKIADNQSPLPVNRVYYDFNYFDNVWQKVNQTEQNGIDRVRIYRQLIGGEKTFWDGYASIGVRLPINTITADSSTGQSTPTKTAINNFSVYTKFLFYSNQETKTFASWGVAGTIPTGPQSFGGANYVRNYNNFDIQPYLGFQKSWDKFYFLAFEAVNVPLNSHDVTTLYNDYSLGYFIFRSQDKSSFIQAIAPTLELHVNVPLNHRNIYNFNDKAGSADVVDFTYGLNVFFRERAQLGLGVVTPVSGPRPFSLEALAFLNFYF